MSFSDRTFLISAFLKPALNETGLIKKHQFIDARYILDVQIIHAYFLGGGKADVKGSK